MFLIMCIFCDSLAEMEDGWSATDSRYARNLEVVSIYSFSIVMFYQIKSFTMFSYVSIYQYDFLVTFSHHLKQMHINSLVNRYPHLTSLNITACWRFIITSVLQMSALKTLPGLVRWSRCRFLVDFHPGWCSRTHPCNSLRPLGSETSKEMF